MTAITRNALAPAPVLSPPGTGAWTASGALVFVMTFALAGSAFRSLRLELGGMLVHPYLPIAVLLGLWLLPARIHQIPRNVLASGALFCAVFWISTAPYSGGIGDAVKLVASVMTTAIIALAVRTRADFLLGVTGLTAAAVVLSVRGLTGDSSGGAVGINPLEEVGNKNAFSLYVLPPLLLALHVAVDRGRTRVVRLSFGAAVALMGIAILSTANRSGWAGAALAILMVLALQGARIRNVATVLAIGIAVGVVVTQSSGATAVIQDRVELTREGYESDNVRVDLVRAAVEVGLENPVIGVSPQRLPLELARRVRVTHARRIDPHNTFAALIGGCGVLGVLSLIAFGTALWRSARLGRETLDGVPSAEQLLKMMLVLWVFRSLFTREILFIPGFAMGLGLCLGLVLVVAREQSETA